MAEPLIELDDVARTFGGQWRLIGGRAPALRAVRGVSLDVARGETLGIVGESGCGKSTLARMLVGLDRPSGGAIRLGGAALASDSRAVARRVQYVFQDPVASLNPRKTIRATLEAPLIRLHGMDAGARTARMAALMESVGLPAAFLDRYPHELSGGQAQRVAIARALAAEPEVIVLDEPVSALDVSVQAQVLTLLADLKARLDLTYVLISHDLAVVESVADRVAVMYFGRVVELGPVAEVMGAPRHPYTRLLLDSAPVPGRGPAVPEDGSGELPDPYAPPEGCAFRGRCPRATGICARVDPPLDGPGHPHACHNPLADRAA